MLSSSSSSSSASSSGASIPAWFILCLSLVSAAHHPPYPPQGRVEVDGLGPRKQCTVYAHGSNSSTANDVPNVLRAFDECGNGGRIVFPEDQNYFIASKMNPVVKNVEIEWRGTWTFSPNITYWRQPQNHFPITFQNHAASFVLTGDGIRINGYGTGNIQGNGDVWYTAEAGDTQPGRPMPFVFWNVSDVVVDGFSVHDPPLWSLNIMNGTDMYFSNVYCNATATKAPYGTNWVQNTDGFDTMDATNIHLRNFTYQGGDDCVAIKPRSYNIDIANVTCHGGNGIAIGSLGQYLEDSSVENIRVSDVRVRSHNNDMHGSAYIKTWIGVPTPQSSYESAGLPRGGGWGVVRNVVFRDFVVEGANSGPGVTQDNGEPGNGSFGGTSRMRVENVAFVNFTGYLRSASGGSVARAASVSCSEARPCFNVAFEDVALRTAENSSSLGASSCAFVETGGVHGLNGSGCT